MIKEASGILSNNYFIDKEQFSKRLCDLFLEKECKSIELELYLGVGRATVSRWRNGHTLPNNSQIREIAEFFGVRYDWLIGNDDFKTIDEQHAYYFPDGKVKLVKEEMFHHWTECFGYKIGLSISNHDFDEDMSQYISIEKNGVSVLVSEEDFEKIEEEIEDFVDYKFTKLFENANYICEKK